MRALCDLHCEEVLQHCHGRKLFSNMSASRKLGRKCQPKPKSNELRLLDAPWHTPWGYTMAYFTPWLTMYLVWGNPRMPPMDKPIMGYCNPWVTPWGIQRFTTGCPMGRPTEGPMGYPIGHPGPPMAYSMAYHMEHPVGHTIPWHAPRDVPCP